MARRPEAVNRGTALSELVKVLNLTNYEAARFVGVTERTFYRWIKGDTAFPDAILRLLQLERNRQAGSLNPSIIQVSWK